MKMSIPNTRRAGVGLALAAAVTSGVAVHINGFAVLHAPGATSFTSAKNLVAALVVTAVASLALRTRPRPATRPLTGWHRLGLAYIGVVGGGVAFALFFEGLARASATQSAFVQKSLVLWVALLAVPLLREKVGFAHAGAIGALMAGQLLLTGDVTKGAPGAALAMVLGATLLWAVEVVVARRVLEAVPPSILGAVRMTAGSAVLLGWLAVSHRLGQLGSVDWGWAIATGLVLAAYVTLWFAALHRAPAVDVTAVLVAGAFVTALLSAHGTQLPLSAQVAGMALVAAGVATVVHATSARARDVGRATGP